VHAFRIVSLANRIRDQIEQTPDMTLRELKAAPNTDLSLTGLGVRTCFAKCPQP